MRTPFLTILFLSAALYACGGDHDHDHTTAAGVDGAHDHDHGDGAHDHDHAATPLLAVDDWGHHGHGVHAGESHPLADVLEDPQRFVAAGVIRVGGPILQVCQDTGSWLRLGTDEAHLMVRVKDRAYFVPKDAAGEAVVEGTLTMEEVSVELQRAELVESGRPDAAANVTAPLARPILVATGVAIAKDE